MPIYPRYPGAEQLGPAGAHLLPDPQLLQRLSGSALIKLEEKSALRRCTFYRTLAKERSPTWSSNTITDTHTKKLNLRRSATILDAYGSRYPHFWPLRRHSHGMPAPRPHT